MLLKVKEKEKKEVITWPNLQKTKKWSCNMTNLFFGTLNLNPLEFN